MQRLAPAQECSSQQFSFSFISLVRSLLLISLWSISNCSNPQMQQYSTFQRSTTNEDKHDQYGESIAKQRISAPSPRKIAIIGSGNWGTAVARLVAKNMNSIGAGCRVVMWVKDEIINGRPLTDIINEDHVNVKYLPGVDLPDSIEAVSEIELCVRGADVLVFVVPHQFLPSVLDRIKDLGKDAIPGQARAISLIKGISFLEKNTRKQTTGSSVEVDPELVSDMIGRELGMRNVAVLMGANVANDVARDELVEATLAARDIKVAESLAPIFQADNFRVTISSDVSSVEMCGALKNVVAMAAGFCDGLDLGVSTKAAVIRQGITETLEFCRFFGGEGFQMGTLFESCGIADIVATSFGGRNRLCSAEFAKLQDVRHRRLIEEDLGAHRHRAVSNTEKVINGEDPIELAELWGSLEKSLLAGQKIQV